MSRSPAAVGDRTPVRAGAAGDDGSGGSGQVRYLRTSVSATHGSPSFESSRTRPGRTGLDGASERRRLERDLHDGVQSELVALIVKLAVAQQDPDTPPAVADMLAGLEALAQAALDSVRNIARGIRPPVLTDFGLEEALRGQAARAAVDMSLVGTPPCSTEEAEETVYFACSEAIQNVAKHAGAAPRATLRFLHRHGVLVVRFADDGRGFDPVHTREGAGLRNIRDRVADLGGTVKLASKPGSGTVLTLSLPWLPAAPRRP